MAGWKQKHQIVRWMGRLLVILSLTASWGCQAAEESVPGIYMYCNGFEMGTVFPIFPVSVPLGHAGCTYTTLMAAGQAFVSSYKVVIRPDSIVLDSCVTARPPYGYNMCSYNYTMGSSTYHHGTEIYTAFGCPVPTVNPTVPYQIIMGGYGNNECRRTVPDTILTITLSGGTSVEPWHKKADAEHKKTNLTYTATVMDTSKQPAQPVSNVEVTITTDVIQDSGGHVHIDGRPKGKLAIPTDPIKDGKETLSGKTDSNGVYSFVFGSEEASGTHTLTAKCTGCQAPATATVKVEIQGLLLLDRDPLSYTLNGEKSWHPGSHYFSAAAMTKIINLAFAFSHDPLFNKQLLIINDSSLIKGGVLDLGQDWTYTPNGHQGHRKGVVVDINNFQAEDPDFEKFVEYLNSGIQAQWHSRGTAPHYHLLLLGKDE